MCQPPENSFNEGIIKFSILPTRSLDLFESNLFKFSQPPETTNENKILKMKYI